MSFEIVLCPRHGVSHYCGSSRPGEPYHNFLFKPFCGASHPGFDFATCRRLKGHPGVHAAFTTRITRLTEWSS